MPETMYLFFYEEQAHMNEVFVGLFANLGDAVECKVEFDKNSSKIPGYYPEWSHVIVLPVIEHSAHLDFDAILRKYAK